MKAEKNVYGTIPYMLRLLHEFKLEYYGSILRIFNLLYLYCRERGEITKKERLDELYLILLKPNKDDDWMIAVS